MTKVDTLVIGAGPSGLALAYGLQGDTIVLEKEDSVGGLCRSITKNGGVFDIGGHSFHTPYQEVFDLVNRLLQGGLYLQERDARIFTHDTLIPYPFQKNYELIPDAEVVAACANGLRNVVKSSTLPGNFEEFIHQRFGDGIAEHFMLPYNRKLWARDLKRISSDWTSERVAAPKGVLERFERTGGNRAPLQSDTEVGYPRAGGFEEIFKGFVPKIPVLELNSPVFSIEPKHRIASTNTGKEYRWKTLVSTMPLPKLVRVVQGTPDDVIAAADALEYLSLRVELLLVDHQLDTPLQRIYVSDPEMPAHKIALNHNSSVYLRDLPRHAIMAEVSVSPEKEIDVDQIADKITDLLCELRILKSPKDIVWKGHVDIEYAYPVYTHDRLNLTRVVKEWMAQFNIHTLGRFGDWEYINSDKCIVKGLSLAQKLRNQGLDN